MTTQQFDDLKLWFQNYVKTFYSNDKEIQTNILLKENHTFRVCSITEELLSWLKFNKEDALLALTVSLFHDIGRFQQFQQYRTFKDSQSEDHALLGIKILEEHKVLSILSKKEQDLIFTAIQFHNAEKLSQNLSSKVLPYAKIIRDVDKLDIYFVITRYYENPVKHRLEAIGSTLSSDESFTRDVINRFLKGERMNYTCVKTKNDLKVLQLGWIFDLNFDFSLSYISENKYLHRILDTIPNSAEKEMIQNKINNYMQNRIS